MMTGKIKVNDNVKFLYPNHGKGNVLRRVVGKIVNKGSGEHGKFISVEEENGDTKNFSYSKIVSIIKRA